MSNTLHGHAGWVRSVCFSPDGNTLASGSTDRTIRLWALASPNAEPIVLTGHDGSIKSVAFSPDGKSLASASADQTLRLWLTFEALHELACQKVRRNLTEIERNRFLEDEPARPICQEWK